MNFRIVSQFSPSGDQPSAIEKIIDFFKSNEKHQVLLGATGTGKTFTMANVIQELQKSTLILVHNKTLAMQIYSEMKNFFPRNKVEYYVSYFDYYRPESYKPNFDIYFEKRTQRNPEIEKMRMNTLQSLSTEKFVIVIASVASIYGTLNPSRYRKEIIEINIGDVIHKEVFLSNLSNIGYSTEKKNLKIFDDEKILKISVDYRDGHFFQISFFKSDNKVFMLEKVSYEESSSKQSINKIFIHPIQYIVEKGNKMKKILSEIKRDLNTQSKLLILEGKYLEERRLKKIVSNDIIDIKEFGFCNGVENYSIYFDRRSIGESPFVIFDFFEQNDFLTIIDESHITIPQVRAMYNTDRNRKLTLIKYGFRLPSALENRPLNFEEFESKLNKVLYVSATPGNFELNKVGKKIVEQIIRPTGLLDPKVEVRSSDHQIIDIINEVKKRIKDKEKTLIYALTINMSEDIASYLQSQGIKATFIHSRLNVFERYQAISNLRRGIYDVIVGINILKEGIDIPEVSLVCIIDADKPGFLRDFRSLIQIIGRAARNQNGNVIFYANNITKDMKNAIKETERRRKIQKKYNLKNNIKPSSIKKEILNILLDPEFAEIVSKFKSGELSEKDKKENLKNIESLMKKSVREFNFDRAIEFRNLLFDLKNFG